MGITGYLPEKKIINQPTGVTFKQMEYFQKQMKNSICKIKCKGGGYGSGFLCLIPYPTKLKLLPVLITNNHILKQKDIEEKETIEFSIFNDNNKFSIFIDDLRETYTSGDYDTTIIEIKEKDNLDINSFLEIDYDIFQEQSYDKYEQKSVYLLHYPNETVIYSIGVIKYIDEKYNINHLCYSEDGSSGGPILNLLNFKVIGIHKGGKIGKEMNVGTLIKAPLDEFNNKRKEKENDSKEKKEINDSLMVKDNNIYKAQNPNDNPDDDNLFIDNNNNKNNNNSFEQPGNMGNDNNDFEGDFNPQPNRPVKKDNEKIKENLQKIPYCFKTYHSNVFAERIKTKKFNGNNTHNIIFIN